MHEVVKLVIDDDKCEINDPKWCLVVDGGGSGMTLCTGEVFGFGEGDADGETKTVKRGGITCPNCLKKLKWFKSIRL